MPEPLIRCEHVSKKFCKSLKRGLWYGVSDAARDLFAWGASAEGVEQRNRRLRLDEFWANEDVSFEVRRGECLGLIGRNGAGKTTLLKMLNGLIKPDCGRIEMRGRVGALIALSAGFNPILTGRENIHINGSILGLSRRQIADSLDEIVDFAELGEFIDTPVQNYSSGMQVRLGFAIAAVLVKPDILLLDEVLAVGDIGFTIKCLNAVRRIANNSAVVFVSHSMQFVSMFCSRILVMANGKVTCDTPSTGLGIDQYLRTFSIAGSVSGTGGATVLNAALEVNGSLIDHTLGGEFESPHVPYGTSAVLRFDVDLAPCVDVAEVYVELLDPLKVHVAISYPGASQGHPNQIYAGRSEVAIDLGPLELNQGLFRFVISIVDPSNGNLLYRSDLHAPFRVVLDRVAWSSVVRYSPANVSRSRPRLEKLASDRCFDLL